MFRTSIYLVMAGTVGVSQIADDGSEVLLEIVRPEELFGESAFIDDPRRSEQATAIGKAKVMAWAVSFMEDLVMTRPRLAVALLQILAQRNTRVLRAGSRAFHSTPSNSGSPVRSSVSPNGWGFRRTMGLFG